MAAVSQIPLPISKHPCPWSTKYLSREQAGCNQGVLTGLAVLDQEVSDFQLSELLQIRCCLREAGTRRDPGAQVGK